MSNFIITNNISKFEKAVSNFTKRGLNESCKFTLGDTHFASFNKRSYVNENYLSISNKNFVACVGTFIYKDSKGKDALTKLYRDFNNNVKEIQEKAIFQGTIIIKKGNDIVVFCDKYNVHWTYYYSINNTFFISSSLKETINALDEKVLIMDRFLEALMQRGTMGNNMFYDGVKKLFGNETIIINNNLLKIDTYLYDINKYDFSQSTEKEIVDTFSEAFLNTIESTYKAFGSEIAIHQSGGLDSRLILSAFLKLGYKPNLIYGTGNSPLTSQYDQDKVIIEKIAKKYELKTYFMNWNINGLIGEIDTIEGFNRYGFNCNENYCNKNWYSEYQNNVGSYGKLLFDGHMGETLNIEGEDSIFNGVYPNAFSMRSIFDEYQKVFFTNFYWKSENKKAEHIEYLRNEHNNLVNGVFEIPHNGDIMDINHYQKYWWLRYRPADSHPTNLFNDFFSSFSPLGTSNLHDITMSIPFNLIKNREFSIKIIDKFAPDLNSVGLFSRAKSSKIKNGKIIRTGGTKMEILRSIHKNTPQPLIDIYRKIKSYSASGAVQPSDPMRDFYINNIEKIGLLNNIFDFKKQKGDVRVLATTYIYLKAVEALGYDKVK
jgi:hypothetical protein